MAKTTMGRKTDIVIEKKITVHYCSRLTKPLDKPNESYFMKLIAMPEKIYSIFR